MFKKNIALAILCLTISLNGIAFGQGFNSITTSDGINLTAVGNSGKVYRSANSGAGWSSTIFGAANMSSATSFGSDVWIASTLGNVYKTQSNLSPIVSYNTGSANNLNSVTFVNSTTGYACGDLGTIVKSTNGGVNWFNSNSGVASVKLNSINFSTAGIGRVVGNTGNIYVTTNGGTTWIAEVSGTVRNLLKIKYFNDSAVAVGEYGTLLLNNGASWSSISTRTKSDIRSIAGANMNDVHVCGGGGFIRNNKSGSSAFMNFEQNPMQANLVDILYYGGNKGWAVSSLNSVIIYTTDAGTTWSMPAGATLTRTWVSKLSVGGGIGNNLCEHPVDRNVLFVVYGSTVYRSSNKGDNWATISTVTGGGSAHSFYVSPLDTNIFMCAITGSPDRIMRSTNYGVTWTNVLNGNFSNYGQPLEMDQNNPSNYYFAPDGGGFYRSTDNGATFTEISGNYPFLSPCDIIVKWDNSNEILVGDGITGSGQAKIYKSTNNGVNWTLKYTVASSETPSLCNSVFDNALIYSTEWGGSGFYKTTNSGENWSLAGATGGSGWGSDVCHEDPTMVLKGTYGSPHYLSTNSGTSFNSSSCGGGAGAGIIVPDRSYLIAMQTSGLFKMTIVYTDAPVLISIDVQALSLGNTGVQYFPSATINPAGTVKNNNGSANATFTVTRKITPGNYVSIKNIVNLGASATTTVTFDAWTFNSGTTYTVKDSVYIFNDANNANDVLSGTITPYVGQNVTRLDEAFTGSYPPPSWTFSFSGTNYWKYNSTASGYGAGTGSTYYNFWTAGNTTGSQSLVTPTFSSSIAGDSLGYDFAYSPYSGSIDSLIIEYSVNGGSSYSTLVRLRGQTSDTIGVGNSFVTVAASGSQFTPTAAQWRSKKWLLPVGTNKIKLRAVSAFGNDLFLDNIKINSGSVYTQVNLTVAPEGYYNGVNLNTSDTITVYLRNIISPYGIVDSAITIINAGTITASAVFTTANTGTYYFQINHRNSMETWSRSGGELLTRGVLLSYDFTNAQNKTYGNNSILSGTKYFMYGGDVNKDGLIDASDMNDIDNAASTGVTGYVVTDLNGDETVDASDLSIADNNIIAGISVNNPTLSPTDTEILKAIAKQRNADYKIK